MAIRNPASKGEHLFIPSYLRKVRHSQTVTAVGSLQTETYTCGCAWKFWKQLGFPTKHISVNISKIVYITDTRKCISECHVLTGIERVLFLTF